MIRSECYRAWNEFYATLDRPEAIRRCEGTVHLLRGRMKEMGRSKSKFRSGYIRSSLVKVLGMALGVHQQLLWGLRSAP